MNNNDDIFTPIGRVSKDRVRALETKIKRLEKENLALKKLDAFLKARLEEDNR